MSVTDDKRPGLSRIRHHDLADAGPIGFDRPWIWLAQGWQDVARAPVASLGLGLALTLLSLALAATLAGIGLLHLLLPLACGFTLIGPLVAVGFYELSRRLEAGQPPTLAAALGAYRRNAAQLAGLGLVLVLAQLFWVEMALMLFALFFGQQPPVELRDFIELMLFSTAGLPFLAVGTTIGAVLAAAVFAISALSIPLLLDSDCDVVNAAMTSVRVVGRNWRAMAGWAGLIVLFTAAGIVTGFLGLTLVLPLVGHASWHAYRDLIGRDLIGPA